MEPWPEDNKPQQPAPPAPATPAVEPPPAEPAGLLQLLEDTLTVPFALGKVFVKQAQAPSPGLSALAANVAVYSACFLALLVLRFRLSFPESAGAFDPAKNAIGLAIGVLLITAGSFICAGMLQLLSQAAGGRADYRRSYHALSLLALFLPASAAASAFAFGWPALAVFWTYLTVVAVENLLQAPAARARAVFGGAAVIVIGGVWFASVQADKYLAPFVQAARLKAQFERQYQDAAAAGALSQRTAGVDASSSAFDAASQANLLLQNFQQGSSLNLVSGPAAPQLPTPAQVAAIAQEIQKQPSMAPKIAAQSIDQVLPMLSNPALTKGMTPEQAKQTQALSGLLQSMGANMKAGKPISPDQQAQLMKMQQDAMQMMLQRKQAPPAQPQPQPQPQGGQQ